MANKKVKSTASGHTGRGTQPSPSVSRAARTPKKSPAKRKLAETDHIANDGPSKRTRSRTLPNLAAPPSPSPPAAAATGGRPGENRGIKGGPKRGLDTPQPVRPRNSGRKGSGPGNKPSPSSSVSQRRKAARDNTKPRGLPSTKRGGLRPRSILSSTRRVEGKRGDIFEREREDSAGSESESEVGQKCQPGPEPKLERESTTDIETEAELYPKQEETAASVSDVPVKREQNDEDHEIPEHEEFSSSFSSSSSLSAADSLSPFTAGLERDRDEIFESLFRGVEYNSAAAQRARVRAYAPAAPPAAAGGGGNNDHGHNHASVKARSTSVSIEEDLNILHRVPQHQEPLQPQTQTQTEAEEARPPLRELAQGEFNFPPNVLIGPHAPSTPEEETDDVVDDDDDGYYGERPTRMARVRAEVQRELLSNMRILELQQQVETARVRMEFAEARVGVLERFIGRLLGVMDE